MHFARGLRAALGITSMKTLFYVWALISLSLCGAQAAEPTVPLNPMLRDELIELRRVDQEIRTADHIVVGNEMDIDARNTARLKEIVAKYGWPTNSMVGEEAAAAAWLLAQHADQDPDFQRSVLALMEKLLPQGEANRSQYAYLYDRTHRPQRYGTQGDCASPGKWEPREIEDPEHVDERRASMSINPWKLSEYIQFIGKLCE